MKNSKQIDRNEFAIILYQECNEGKPRTVRRAMVSSYRAATLARDVVRLANRLRRLIASSDDGCGGMRRGQEAFDAARAQIERDLSALLAPHGIRVNIKDPRGALVKLVLPRTGRTNVGSDSWEVPR